MGLPDIEWELARGLTTLRFGRELERAFDRHERLARTGYLIVSGGIGCVIFVAFLAFDWQLLPDVIGLACLLRLAVFMPLMIGVLFVLAFVKNSAMREGALAVTAVVAAVIIMSLVLASRSPYRCAYHYGTILVMMNVVVLRLRFSYAAAATIGMLAVIAAAVLRSDAFDEHVRAADAMFFLAGSTFLLTAAYGIEREARRGFLLALKSGCLHEALERSASSDPLTGLGNRRRLDAGMTAAWRDAGEGSEMAILVVDVDHFKSFNDCVGHVDGDACLRRVAETVRGVLDGRSGEAIRFGGEEFVLFLPETGRAPALAVADDVVGAVRAASIPHPARGPDAIVAISVGVSVGNPRFTSPQDLLRSADLALYAAKAAGRDRVRFREPSGDAGPDVDLRAPDATLSLRPAYNLASA